MSGGRAERGWILLVGVLTALTVAAQVPWLLEPGLFIDEIFTIRDAGKPISTLLLWQHHHYHPPLSYLLVKAACWVLGSTEPWVIRLPAFVAGTLCVPAAFVLGRRIATPWVGAAFALLVAVEPHLIDQGTLARMYSLHALLLLVLMIAVEGAARRPRHELRPWLVLGLILSLIAWTSAAFWILLLALPIAWLGCLIFGPRESATNWRGLCLAAGMALLALIPCLVHYATSDTSNGDGAGTQAIAREWYAAIVQLFYHPVVAAAVLVAGVVGLARRVPAPHPAATTLLAVGALNLLAMFALRTTHTAIMPRYLVSVQLATLLGVAVLLGMWHRRSPAPATIVLLMLAAFLATQGLFLPRSSDYELSQRLRTLAEEIADGDAVLYVPGSLGDLGRYFGMTPEPELSPEAVYEMKRQRLVLDAESLPHARTWLIAYTREDQKGHDQRFRWVVSALAERYGCLVPTREVEAAIRAGHPVVMRFEPDAIVFRGE